MPPRAEACSPTSSARPSRSAQNGASAQCAEPVTGSSSMPTPGAKKRLTQSMPSRSPGAVTMTPRASTAARARDVGRASGPQRPSRAPRRGRSGSGRRVDVGARGPGRARRRRWSAPGAGRGSPSRSSRRPPSGTRARRSRVEAPVPAQDVGAGERGVAAQVDLDRRREPAQVVRPVGSAGRGTPSPRGSSRWRRAASDGVGRAVEPAHGGGVPAEGGIGERVDDTDRDSGP